MTGNINPPKGVLKVHLVYELPGQNQSVIALDADRSILISLARLAIAEASVKATEWSVIDEALGYLEQDKVMKLSQFLSTVIPGLQNGENGKGVH